MANTLSHLTLNTGHLRASPRSEVAQDAIDRLLPVVDAQGGPVPGMDGWHLDLFFPCDARGARRDGAAFFQIADEPGTSKRPAVMAVACWREDASAEAWAQALGGYAALRAALSMAGLWRDPPPSPPPTPWLAVWLTPFLALADAETAGAFGDLERCVVWALHHGA